MASPLPGLYTATFWLCPHMGEREERRKAGGAGKGGGAGADLLPFSLLIKATITS